jgi:hypothetical protein
MTARPGSARATRASNDVPVIANFSRLRSTDSPKFQEDRFGEAAETSTRAACAPRNAVDASSLFI